MGEDDTDGIEITSTEVDLNETGSILDIAGNAAELVLNNVGETTGITINTAIPSIVSVGVPAAGTYGIGDSLDLTLNFSESVIVNNAPRIELTIGASKQYANYTSGSGSNVLVFRYTVTSGVNDSDGIVVSGSSIDLNTNGTLKDADGNEASLLLNTVGDTSSVKVDTVAPNVTSVSVPDTGTYGGTENLDFTVNFSETVNVDTTNGTPTFELALGTTSRDASYTSGTGSAALVFRYTLASGDASTGATVGVSSNTIELHSGTIQDAGKNNANAHLNQYCRYLLNPTRYHPPFSGIC